MHTLTLAFDGEAIFHNRQDGSLALQALRVEDAAGNQVDFLRDAYATAAYTATAFQHSGTSFDAASYTDEGVDVNGNGDYDFLRFGFALDVEQRDAYRLLASLSNSSGATIDSVARDVALEAGRQTVALDFSGPAISERGVDGAYTVGSLALLGPDGGVVDYHPVAQATQVYSATQFEYRGFVYLPLVLR